MMNSEWHEEPAPIRRVEVLKLERILSSTGFAETDMALTDHSLKNIAHRSDSLHAFRELKASRFGLWRSKFGLSTVALPKQPF